MKKFFLVLSALMLVSPLVVAQEVRVRVHDFVRRAAAFAGVGLVSFVLLGCTTFQVGERTFEKNHYYPFELSAESPLAYFDDAAVVHTSFKENSAVEVRLRLLDYGMMVLVYVENRGSERFNFGPSDVRFLAMEHLQGEHTIQGEFEWDLVRVYEGAEPEFYSEEYVARANRGGSQMPTGGFGAYLSGASLGESIIAQNQRSTALSQARRDEDREVQNLRSDLVGLTTLFPGDSVAGGVGMGTRDWWLLRKDDDGTTTVQEPWTRRNGMSNYDIQRIQRATDRLAQNPPDIFAYSVFNEGNLLNVDIATGLYTGYSLLNGESTPLRVRHTLAVRAGNEIHLFNVDLGAPERMRWSSRDPRLDSRPYYEP